MDLMNPLRHDKEIVTKQWTIRPCAYFMRYAVIGSTVKSLI